MHSWSETIQLPKPLREARLKGSEPASLPDVDRFKSELEASYQRGLIDGEKLLTEQLIQQRNEMHELANGVLESLQKTVPQVIRETENTMVSLALTVAQKLVAGMPVSVEMVEVAVRDALTQLEGTSRFTVRLNPADLELLQKAGSSVLTPGETGGDFRFLSSSEVTRGGCVVETNFGTIDARRETKMDLMKRSLAA